MRISQLRNQLDEISGETKIAGSMGEGKMSLECELSFLEHVIAFETKEATTWKRELAREGYVMPDPASLAEEDIQSALWTVIHRLAAMNVYLSNSNHLSDREMYHTLYEWLDDSTTRLEGTNSRCHIDLCDAPNAQSNEPFLQYYADEAMREQTRAQFGTELPPRLPVPYQRDSNLPRPTDFIH